MARLPTKFEQPVIDVATTDEQNGMAVALRSAQQDAQLVQLQNANACAMATQLGYEGSLTVGTLEDEIRFYQRRTVESCLELGKRLLLLKEITPHGEFEQRIELLGFEKTSAFRFMKAAAKTAKSCNLQLLSTQVKSMSAFLELVTQDDEVIESVSDMTDIQALSASQLRERLVEMEAKLKYKDDQSATQAAQIEELLIAKQKEEKLLDKRRAAVGAVSNDVLKKITQQLRDGFKKLQSHEQNGHDSREIMSGMLKQIETEVSVLRNEFFLE